LFRRIKSSYALLENPNPNDNDLPGTKERILPFGDLNIKTELMA
jgi:hypothetical protein